MNINEMYYCLLSIPIPIIVRQYARLNTNHFLGGAEGGGLEHVLGR